MGKSNGWVMDKAGDEHVQVQVHNPLMDKTIGVDEGLVELLQLIWKSNIVTYLSCQENQPGVVWIDFPVDAARDFIDVIITQLGTNSDICYAMYQAFHNNPARNWNYNMQIDDDDDSIDLNLSIRFPDIALPNVVRAFEAHLSQNGAELVSTE